MVIDLRTHGLGGNAKAFRDFATSVLSEVTSDKGVKAKAVSQAIQSITGVTPVIDTSDPAVIWVRTTPAHGEFIDAVFLKSAKKIAAGPSKGRPADLKIDVMPALKPFLIRRALPLALLAGFTLFAAGYYYAGRK